MIDSSVPDASPSPEEPEQPSEPVVYRVPARAVDSPHAVYLGRREPTEVSEEAAAGWDERIWRRLS